jgi:hypothetical protein
MPGVLKLEKSMPFYCQLKYSYFVSSMEKWSGIHKTHSDTYGYYYTLFSFRDSVP